MIVWRICRLATASASAGAVLRFAMDAVEVFHAAYAALQSWSNIQAKWDSWVARRSSLSSVGDWADMPITMRSDSLPGADQVRAEPG
jgi:hypothetical protein